MAIQYIICFINFFIPCGDVLRHLRVLIVCSGMAPLTPVVIVTRGLTFQTFSQRITFVVYICCDLQRRGIVQGI